MAEVTQRFLRRSLFVFDQGELITEVDEEFTVAEPLPGGQDHDTREVEVVVGLFFLAEVAHHVEPIGLALAQNVEVEGVDLVPNILVV